MDQIAKQIHPLIDTLCDGFCSNYEFGCYESEWATDTVFKKSEDLRKIFPDLVQNGISTFGSRNVMRFLGRRISESGKIPSVFDGEVVTSVTARDDKVRIKHFSDKNSVKM